VATNAPAHHRLTAHSRARASHHQAADAVSPAAARVARPAGTTSRGQALVGGLYALGALLLAGEASVHVQQFVVIFHAVRWIGPLFVANATACALAIVGLAYKPTRQLAALAGVAISVAALGGLALSYTAGLFGWMESGLRGPITVAIVSEVGAVIVLGATFIAATTWGRRARIR
jgi:hypothetical protein